MKRVVRIAALLIWAALFVSCEEEGCNTAFTPSIWLNNSTKNAVVFRVSSSGRYVTRIVGPEQSVNVLADLDTPFTIGVQPEKPYTELMTNEESKLRAQLKALDLVGWKQMDELQKQMGGLHAQVQRLEKNESAKCSIRLSTEGPMGHAKASLDQNGRLKLECSAQ